MKKLFLMLSLFILCASNSFAVGPVFLQSIVGGGSAPNACSSCTPGDPYDVFCEDFEGSNNPDATCTCTGWEVGSETGDTQLHSGLPDTLGCSGKGDSAYKLVANEADGAASIRKDITDTGTLEFTFYVLLDSTGEELDNDDRQYFFALYGNNGATALFWIRCQWTAADHWMLRPSWKTAASTNDQDSANTYDEGAWIEVRGAWYKNALNTSWVSFDDGVSSETLTISDTTDNVDVDRIVLRAEEIQALTGTEAVAFSFDCLFFDDDTAPGDCPGVSP